MDYRSGSRVLEIALIAVIVVGTALNVAVLISSIPILAGLYARADLALPLPLELYIRAANAAVCVWSADRSDHPWCVSVLQSNTFGRASLLHAVRLSVATAAPVQVLDRDLSLLYLAVAESYRSANDVEAARRLYQRAQAAAVRFDKELTERLLANEVRWRNEFGPDFEPTWLPPTSDMRRRPELIRSVSQQRLDQIAAKP